jgi:hypothetical protein
MGRVPEIKETTELVPKEQPSGVNDNADILTPRVYRQKVLDVLDQP